MIEEQTSRWYVTWGSKVALEPGQYVAPSRWARVKRRLLNPIYGIWYTLEDWREVVPDRVRGAWRVLTGRAGWY